jgi:hypothetical protein
MVKARRISILLNVDAVADRAVKPSRDRHGRNLDAVHPCCLAVRDRFRGASMVSSYVGICSAGYTSPSSRHFFLVASYSFRPFVAVRRSSPHSPDQFQSLLAAYSCPTCFHPACAGGNELPGHRLNKRRPRLRRNRSPSRSRIPVHVRRSREHKPWHSKSLSLERAFLQVPSIRIYFRLLCRKAAHEQPALLRSILLGPRQKKRDSSTA